MRPLRRSTLRVRSNNAPKLQQVKKAPVKRLRAMDERLLLSRRWAYLRYLHAREALALAEGVESVLVIGSGRGYAEIKLALEFPEIRFHLTDIESDTAPYYQNTQRLAKAWGMDNLTFGIRDILRPKQGRYDLVASTEVLEHIWDADLAAAQMRASAGRYVFALTPSAVDAANADRSRRDRAWKEHGHYVVGYHEKALHQMFPGIVAMRGCYWSERGGPHRERLYQNVR